MRPLLRSPAPIVLVIAAVPGLGIAYASASAASPMTKTAWLLAGGCGFFIAAAVSFILSALQGRPRTTRPDGRQRRWTALFGWTFLISSIALFVSYWPVVGELISAGVVAWIVLWSVPRMRRTRIVTSFVVRSTPDVVFAFISDARNLPRYRTDTLRVEMMTPEPIGPGSRFREHVRLPNGTELTGEDEYIDFVPDRRFTERSTSMSPNITEMSFEQVDHGTRVTHRLDFEHSFTSSVFGGMFTNGEVTRQILAHRRAAEERIKKILEEGQE